MGSQALSLGLKFGYVTLEGSAETCSQGHREAIFDPPACYVVITILVELVRMVMFREGTWIISE